MNARAEVTDVRSCRAPARETLPRPPCRQRRQPHRAKRGDHRPARAERRGQDHELLHDHRPRRVRLRYRAPRPARAHEPPDARPRPDGSRLSPAGAVDLPPSFGAGERPGDPRDAPGAEPRRPRTASRRAAERAARLASRRSTRRQPVRGRTPPGGDRARLGRGAEIHVARRALRRRRSDLDPGNSANHQALERTRDRGPDHGPQRPRYPRHLRPGVHRQRRDHHRQGAPGRRARRRPRPGGLPRPGIRSAAGTGFFRGTESRIPNARTPGFALGAGRRSPIRRERAVRPRVLPGRSIGAGTMAGKVLAPSGR